MSAVFTQATIDFLSDLAANNTRDWFAENKNRYETCLQAPARDFAARLAAELERETGLAHRETIFRIHRDVRFSRDKTPYNTHLHMAFVPLRESGMPPAWMVGLSPGYFTLGCGVFAFDKAGLARFRAYVAGPGGEAVASLLTGLVDGGVRLGEPKLKRVPAPYDRDHPHGALLRRWSAKARKAVWGSSSG